MKSIFDFAFSAQGYNHIKTNKVCQDSSGHYSDESMAIIAVADGHGSDNYPRTDKGSKYAVEATISAIKEFVNTVEQSALDIFEDSESYMEQLSKSILASWHAAVDSDLEKNPFSEEELAKVNDKYKKRYLSGEKTEKAYGTTLIAACQTKNYWFGLQIGDGKCICVTKDGSMLEPIPWDDDCQANITTSICDSEAIDEFRFCLLKDAPVATFMGTDGIDDSYANDEEMYVLYRSILAIFAEHGQEVGEKEINDFLPGLSRKGSGDDVSIGGLISSDISDAFIAVLKAQCEYSNARALKEKAERELTLAAEKEDYVKTALSKAKTNYDLCKQRAEEVKKEIETAQQAKEDAVIRFDLAECALANAKEIYQRAIETTKDEQNSIPSNFVDDSASGESKEIVHEVDEDSASTTTDSGSCSNE